MRWKKGRLSQNIEDRRGFGLTEKLSVSGKTAAGGVGVASITAAAVFFGVNSQEPLEPKEAIAPTEIVESAPDNELTKFVSAILADTEDTWTPIFHNADKEYKHPKLVLFTESTESPCGEAKTAAGPFYCPIDEKVYIDLAFYQQLRTRFNAPGDFAQAYVIAHEVGHHVQNLLGITQKVKRAQKGLSQIEKNQIHIRMELQADCFSGVWANHAHRHRDLLEPGDIEEGLKAAAAVGDDTVQKRERGFAVPESFTHGTSAQRQEWFLRGLKSGAMASCNTFSGDI